MERRLDKFKIIAGAKTDTAHYPVHAWVRFELDGKPMVAHPILILKTTLPAMPRPAGSPEAANRQRWPPWRKARRRFRFRPKTSAVPGCWERSSHQSRFRLWPGRRGLLDATVGFVRGDRRLCFHGFEVRVLGDRLEDPGSPAVLTEVKEEPCDGGAGSGIVSRARTPAR